MPDLGGKLGSKAEANRYEPEAKEKRTSILDESWFCALGDPQMWWYVSEQVRTPDPYIH